MRSAFVYDTYMQWISILLCMPSNPACRRDSVSRPNRKYNSSQNECADEEHLHELHIEKPIGMNMQPLDQYIPLPELRAAWKKRKNK